MALVRCPGCGHDVAAEGGACPACGRSLNGAVENTQPPAPEGILPSGKPSPELMEWARREFNEDEFLAGLREVRETGGLELKDFIQDLEQEAGPRD